MASNVVFGAYSPGRLYLKSDRSFSIASVSHPVLNTSRPHKGDDWPTGGQTGVDIRAASDGVVVFNGPFKDYGNAVIIEHTRADGSKFRTLYAHMAEGSPYAVGSRISA